MKKIVILTTAAGKGYGNIILKSILWQKNNRNPEIKVPEIVTIEEIDKLFLENPKELLIHARAAHPTAHWMKKLIQLENSGATVVNSTKTLATTSDKLLFLEVAKNSPLADFTIPTGIIKSNFPPIIPGTYIIKPQISVGQGKYVTKVFFDGKNRTQMDEVISKIPGRMKIIQKFNHHHGIMRVIVIGGKAVPIIFYDEVKNIHGEDWKVSVCLNRKTMGIFPSLSDNLRSALGLAEKAQAIVSGEINFIDIFYNKAQISRTDYRIYNFKLSEINTACNLSIHENLARNFGSKDWNFHYKIAKHLVERAK